MTEAPALALRPSRTVVTSFNPRQTPTASVEDYFDAGDWVLCVHSSPTYISCALSNGEIQIYDPRRLHVVQTISSLHGSATASAGPDENCHRITDLVGAPLQQNADHILVSSGTDGRVCVMDLRQQQQQQQVGVASPSVSFSLPYSQEQALSVSLGYDGNIAAVGSNKARIHFFDLRQTQQPLGSYVNSHTDEVTRVRFQQFPHYLSSTHSSSAGCLLTGSEDGLACIFDTTQPSEEAALKSVMNAQTPLRQVGFFGPNLEGVYCMTGSETMSLWAWDSAQCLADYSDIRALLSVDYLVNAHWDHGRKELSILAGCNNGDACLNILGGVGNAARTAGQRPNLTTSHRLAGGHRGVVRDWCPVSSSLLVTVGEDARMCEWNVTGNRTSVRRLSDPSTKKVLSSKAGGGPVRPPRRQPRPFGSPY